MRAIKNIGHKLSQFATVDALWQKNGLFALVAITANIFEIFNGFLDAFCKISNLPMRHQNAIFALLTSRGSHKDSL